MRTFRLILLLILGAIQPLIAADITWVKQTATATWPGYNGFLTIWYDPLSQCVLLYGIKSNSTTIYSNELFCYKPLTNTFTDLGGTGSLTDQCPLDAATQPGDRHPVWQMAEDTVNNRLWLVGGVNQGCTGTDGNASPRVDMYFQQNHATPTQDWNRVTPANFPVGMVEDAMAFDSTHNVLFWFGTDGGANTHMHFLYCPTDKNPTPGTLTSSQTSVGCAAGSTDNWLELTGITGGPPPGVNFPGLIYDPVTDAFIQYAGASSTTYFNQTWSFKLATKTWTQKCQGGCSPPPAEANTGSNENQPALGYNVGTHRIIYHQSSGTGSPADWSYNPVADTWTKLVSSGSGYSYTSGAVIQDATYDAQCNCIVGFNQASGGAAELWQGTLASQGSSMSNVTISNVSIN